MGEGSYATGACAGLEVSQPLHGYDSMVQEAGIAGMCTRMNGCWWMDKFEPLCHDRYVLLGHLVQIGSPRNPTFGDSPYCQHDIASIANNETAKSVVCDQSCNKHRL